MSSQLYGPEYFAAFRSRLDQIPLQALVLFSPTDESMMAAIRNDADRIQAVTSESVVVFVPLDMAAAWADAQGTKQKRHEPLSVGSWALLEQFVGIGGARWDELPVVVVGRSAFTGPRLVVPTSPTTVVAQLEVAANVAMKFGEGAGLRPFSLALREVSPDQRFTPRPVRSKNSPEVLDELLASLLGVVSYGEETQFESRAFAASKLDVVQIQDERRLQSARAAVHALADPPELPEPVTAIWPELDNESRAFLSTVIVVTDALASANLEVDYAAAGLPLCKLFERQLNLAPVQVARRNRGVPLPARYGLFDPDLMAGSGVVDTSRALGQPQHVNINELDSRSPMAAHQFLTLGQSQHLLRVMGLDCDLGAGLDPELVADLRATTRQVGAIRNHFGAHVAAMPADAFVTLRALVLESGSLVYLAKLAAALRA
ncbi:MAG: hypothetical protein Q8T13_17155 [Acidobacteriota bacterium]|nr:hypothetical protein [Acidobacteriota bacterium]